MTCGEQDGLLPDSQHMAEALKRKGCQVRFEHWPGGHEWRLWDLSVEMAMNELIAAPRLTAP